jgi:hypothetical protein
MDELGSKHSMRGLPGRAFQIATRIFKFVNVFKKMLQ